MLIKGDLVSVTVRISLSISFLLLRRIQILNMNMATILNITKICLIINVYNYKNVCVGVNDDICVKGHSLQFPRTK